MAGLCSCWRSRGLTAALIILALAFASGCNVTGTVEPSPTDVEDLLAEARIAMTEGDHQRALGLLEDAFARDSSNVEVRVELANALYATRGLDLFVVRSVVEQMNGAGGNPGAIDSTLTICSDGAQPLRAPDRFVALALDRGEAIDVLADNREVLRRGARLLIDGVLNRRADAFAKSSPGLQEKGYLLAALTRVARRFLSVRETVLAGRNALYLDDSSSFVACGATVDALGRLERALCTHREGVAQALRWLRLRNAVTGSDQTSLLIEPLQTQLDALGARLSC